LANARCYRWDKERHEEVTEYQNKQREAYSPQAKTTPTNERLSIAEQAKAMLSGEEKWESTEWEDVGEMQEVEQDIKIDGDVPR
jgi:large subunit ribosomal protein L23